MLDLILILLLAGGFLMGFFRGSIRQILSIGAWLLAFLLAANLGQFAGRLFLEGYSFEYAAMLGFGSLLLVLAAGGVIFFQLSGQTTTLTKHELLDNMVGGLLGVALVLLLVSSALVVIDTAYARPSPPEGAQLDVLAQFFNDSQRSVIAGALRDSLIPALGAVLGWVLPQHVTAVMS